MITSRAIDEYVDLLPSASVEQPKFVALLSAALDGLVDVQNCMLGMPDAFDIDKAIGKQLDDVGVRVGLSRKLPIPIAGVYFALDEAGVGFDEGVWLGPNDPTEALTSLDDETYRLLLKLKVRANYWDGSLEDAQEMLGAIAGDGTYIYMQDRFDMTALIGVGGKVPSKLFVSLLKQMKDWIRPAAVDIPLVYVTSMSGSPLFGFDVQNNYIGGFDSGAWAVEY